MRESVERAGPSSSATSSSLSECASRRRRSSAPSLRLRTVGPRGTRSSPPQNGSGACAQCDPPDHCPPMSHRNVTRSLRFVPDTQYDTALMAKMKSHAGFHLKNLCHALAYRRPVAPSSVRCQSAVIRPRGVRIRTNCENRAYAHKAGFVRPADMRRVMAAGTTQRFDIRFGWWRPPELASVAYVAVVI